MKSGIKVASTFYFPSSHRKDKHQQPDLSFCQEKYSQLVNDLFIGNEVRPDKGGKDSGLIWASSFHSFEIQSCNFFNHVVGAGETPIN